MARLWALGFLVMALLLFGRAYVVHDRFKEFKEREVKVSGVIEDYWYQKERRSSAHKLEISYSIGEEARKKVFSVDQVNAPSWLQKGRDAIKGSVVTLVYLRDHPDDIELAGNVRNGFWQLWGGFACLFATLVIAIHPSTRLGRTTAEVVGQKGHVL